MKILSILKIKKRVTKIIVIIFLLLFSFVVIPYAYSRYESSATSNLVAPIAHYLLKADYIQTNIEVGTIVPSDDPYIYTFTISNNYQGRRTEINLEYDVAIRTTTNLPLEYELYINQDYEHPSSTSSIISDEYIQDDHNTYFRELKVAREYFNFTLDEINNYTLVVRFPSQYKVNNYEEIIESVEIIIDSRQKVD